MKQLIIASAVLATVGAGTVFAEEVPDTSLGSVEGITEVIESAPVPVPEEAASRLEAPDREEPAKVEAAEAATLVEAAEPVLTDGQSEVAELEPVDMLIMTPNAKVMFLTTGGNEMRADWTETAQANLLNAFTAQERAAGHTLRLFDPEQEQSEEEQQLLALYEVVSQMSTMHMPHKGKRGKLATGSNNAALTLGPTASLLADQYNAKQALFIDHFSQIESGGVFMTKVLIGAATGYVPASANIRATSGRVVDLETGDVLRTSIAMMGDARSESESANIVSRVMKNLN